MRKESATILGFLVASSVPAILLAVFTPLSGTFTLDALMGTFVVAYLFSAIATVVFGVPIFLVIRKLGVVTWWTAILGGFVAGVLVTVVIRLPSPPVVNDVLLNGPIGAVAAFAFWLVWRLGRESGHDTI